MGRETVLSGSRIVYSKRNDINKKCNSKCFSDATLLFLKTCMKAVDTSVRCSLSNSKKECLRKTRCPDSISDENLQSDEMLTGLMSVSLFYRYFHNFHKGLSPQKKRTVLSDFTL